MQTYKFRRVRRVVVPYNRLFSINVLNYIFQTKSLPGRQAFFQEAR